MLEQSPLSAPAAMAVFDTTKVITAQPVLRFISHQRL